MNPTRGLRVCFNIRLAPPACTYQRHCTTIAPCILAYLTVDHDPLAQSTREQEVLFVVKDPIGRRTRYSPSFLKSSFLHAVQQEDDGENP